MDADPAARSKRSEAARLRAARELEERAAKARQTLAEIGKERQQRAKRSPKEMAAKKEPRASLTDPAARRMRFADGAIRSAYNMQLAITSDDGFITAIHATSRRNDSGLACPMLEEANAVSSKSKPSESQTYHVKSLRRLTCVTFHLR